MAVWLTDRLPPRGDRCSSEPPPPQFWRRRRSRDLPVVGRAAASSWSAPGSPASSRPTGCAEPGTACGFWRRGTAWVAGSTPGAAGPELRWTSVRRGSMATPRATRSRRSRATPARRLVPSSYASGQVHVDPRLRAAGVAPHSGRWARIVDQAEARAGRRPADQSLADAVRRAGGRPRAEPVRAGRAGLLPERHLHDRVGRRSRRAVRLDGRPGQGVRPHRRGRVLPPRLRPGGGVPGPAPERRLRGRRTARGAAPPWCPGRDQRGQHRRQRSGGDGPARRPQARGGSSSCPASPSATNRRSTGWAWGC